MKTGIILLARTGSTRLPGKVLLKVCGKSILEHIIRRLERVKLADDIIVATTLNPKDDAIVELCQRLGISFFRGDEDNVLNRCIQATKAYNLDIVVSLGADSPLIDWEIIDDMLRIFLQQRNKGNRLEYMSNNIDRSYPLGLDAHIFDKGTFSRIDEETKVLPEEERELNEINLMVPYLHQNLDRFRTFSYHKDFDYSHLRWTLDTPEDFELIKKIYEELYPKKPDFLTQDVLDLLAEHPEWSQINSKVIPTSGYWTDIEIGKLKRRLKERCSCTRTGHVTRSNLKGGPSSYTCPLA